MDGEVDLCATSSCHVSFFMSSNVSTSATSMSSIFRDVSMLPPVSHADTLLQMVLDPGPVREVGLFVAALPCHASTRKTEEYVDREAGFPTVKGKWLPWFRSNLRALYAWAVHVCRPAGPNVRDAEAERKKTKKKARAALAGTGLVRRKKVTLAIVGREATVATIQACRPHLCVLWMDNYNKQRFSRNPGVVPSKANRRTAQPGDTNASINGAVFAILPCPGVPAYPSSVAQPSLVSLQTAVSPVVSSIVEARVGLKSRN